MPESYDQRRSRCMLDQSSNTQNPIHLILRSPYALKTGYADSHDDVRALLDAYNTLATLDEPAADAREALAKDAVALSSHYARRAHVGPFRTPGFSRGTPAGRLPHPSGSGCGGA